MIFSWVSKKKFFKKGNFFSFKKTENKHQKVYGIFHNFTEFAFVNWTRRENEWRKKVEKEFSSLRDSSWELKFHVL